MQPGTTPGGDPPGALLVLERIAKRFVGVTALDGVSLEIRAGEVHGLIGENGAGKSTLMRILAGADVADAGTMRLGGRAYLPADPAAALHAGVAMVHQDTRLVAELDIARNLFLGREPGGRVLVDLAAMRGRARELLARLGLELASDRRVATLGLAARQLVEIARALAAEARVLILDEPTSALTPPEVDRLFAVLRDLRAHGTAIVFISHRIPEVLRITDRVSVLKDGCLVGTVETAETSADALVRMMVGRDMALAFPPRNPRPGPPVLTTEGLSGEGFAEVTLSLHAGEITGLGGIAGSGQRGIARALAGIGRARGTMRLAGAPYAPRSPAAALAQGVVDVPADRRGEGLFLPHPIRANVALPHLRGWARGGIVAAARERDQLATVTRALAVRAPSIETPVQSLSGGNQQKVVFARWQLASPKVYVLDEPTQGVDVETKLELYRQIRALAQAGAAVLVLSTDVLELIGLCDRVLVVASGRIVDAIPGEQASEARIIGASTLAAGTGEVARRPDQRMAERPTLRRYAAPLLLLALILALAAVTAWLSPWFLTPRNLGNLALQAAPVALVALGQAAVLLVGGVDLAVGPAVSLATSVAVLVLAPGMPILPGIALCLAAGLAVGALNVLLIRIGRIPDLVATLASYSIVFGAALVLRPAPGGALDPGFVAAVTARLDRLPMAAVVVVALVVAAELLLLRGRIGSWLYATGAAPESAYVAGVPVARVRMLAYLVCAAMGTLAGLIVAARIGGGDPQAGLSFTIVSITAAVAGGVAISGGRGTAIGALLGAVLVVLVQNVLNQLHVSAYWQYIWTGGLLLLAVGLWSARERAREEP